MECDRSTCGVIVAGGSGSRFGRAGGKQLAKLAGRPVLAWTAEAFARTACVDALVVVAPGGSHANLTDQYAAIPAEMKQVASCFGKKTLRGITINDLAAKLDVLRSVVSDRAIMRAFHFVTENDRVPEQVAALKEDRIDDFLKLIIDSGRSSYMYLQNVFASNDDQSLSLALCLAGGLLSGKGAWRIHGGGFAGTTLNFVPTDLVESFVDVMNRAFGEKACFVLNIRPVGAARIELD